MGRNLQLRDLEDDLVARLERRAARNGRSTEAEHREILRQVLTMDAKSTFDDPAADLRAITSKRRQTPSELLLRESREDR